MGARWLLNLALALLVAALAAAVHWELQRAEHAGRLTPLAPGTIEQIVLERRGAPVIRLQREDGTWRMRVPIAAPADTAAVQRLVAPAAARSRRTLPAHAAERARLGLEPPRIRLTLDGLTLRFGDTEPVAERRYVQVGDLVHLIDDHHLPWLLAPPERLLSRRLLPPGFTPGSGDIDGRALGAARLAALAAAEAQRVEPLQGTLAGRLLRIHAADGEDSLRFLIDAGGTRWSRPETRLTYLFETPPLTEADDDPPAAAPR